MRIRGVFAIVALAILFPGTSHACETDGAGRISVGCVKRYVGKAYMDGYRFGCQTMGGRFDVVGGNLVCSVVAANGSNVSAGRRAGDGVGSVSSPGTLNVSAARTPVPQEVLDPTLPGGSGGGVDVAGGGGSGGGGSGGGGSSGSGGAPSTDIDVASVAEDLASPYDADDVEALSSAGIEVENTTFGVAPDWGWEVRDDSSPNEGRRGSGPSSEPPDDGKEDNGPGLTTNPNEIEVDPFTGKPLQ
jgi:hypothetical protein